MSQGSRVSGVFRNEIIHGDDVRDRLMDMMEEVVVQKVVEFTSVEDVTEWRLRGLQAGSASERA